MPIADSSHDGIGRLVEQRIEQWHTEQGKELTLPHLDEGQAEIDYITISREPASGGEEVASILADLLTWQVYDKNILDYMADNMNVHKEVVESVDENASVWMGNWLQSLFKDRPEKQSDYCRHLVNVLLIIARHKKAIILGRAAGLVLPHDNGISVRVTAPYELRCERWAKEKNIPLNDALAEVKKIDQAQKAFVKSFLDEDIDDPKHYDIMCSTEKLSPTSVAKLIWRTLDQRQMPAKDS
jgi:cytidylate kinase